MRHVEEPGTARLAAHRAVAARLSLLSDRRIGELVASAEPLGSGVGGTSAALDVGGTRVFVKRVPLTEPELRPENVRSTANLFGLPTFYQYGIGSAGFGAWRELAAHTLTTHWVLGGESDGFPLMYHWRVLPGAAPGGFMDFLGGVDGAVAHWEGSPAVRERLEAVGRARHSLVLFLEHLPQTLTSWLREHREEDPAVYGWAADAVARGAAFLRSRGLVHFDAHFDNLLTDGRRVCFADFGLALSEDFELSAEERRFLDLHRAYDRDYTAAHLLRHHLLDRHRGGTEATVFLEQWLAGRRPDGVPPQVAAVVDRHARTALVLDGFQRRLLGESRRTPYPAAELDSVTAETA
ncbi:protein kinase family protein [Kitasatospora sp. NPDC058115]|uniref:protein kinase family protein n=1 Tax=Kitasatospora sp. NPDC058115 TaxID=3346347 RepID=UPI0036DCD9DB